MLLCSKMYETVIASVNLINGIFTKKFDNVYFYTIVILMSDLPLTVMNN